MKNGKLKIYTEIGYGNPTFINTEIEYPDGTEKRIPGFKKMNVNDLYFRVWLGTEVYILSTKDGFKKQIKNRSNLKILFGIQGVSLEKN